MLFLKKLQYVLTVVKKALFESGYRKELWRVFYKMRGEGVDVEDRSARRSWIRSHRKELKNIQKVGPLSEDLPVRRESKIGRNERCPCGSGKKYKKCCVFKTDEPKSLP